MDFNKLCNDLHYLSELDCCANCKYMDDKKCTNIYYDSYCRTALLYAYKELDDKERIKHIIKGCLIDKESYCEQCEIRKVSTSCIRSMTAKAYERLSLCMIN